MTFIWLSPADRASSGITLYILHLKIFKLKRTTADLVLHKSWTLVMLIGTDCQGFLNFDYNVLEMQSFPVIIDVLKVFQ